MHIYIYVYIYIQMHTYIHITRLSYAQLYLHTWAPAHARAHTSAHTRARAHRRRRRAQRPAPRIDDPPSASRRGGAPPGAEKAAHTSDNVVTDAVFHAPMFALNASASLNACEPSHTQSTPTEGRSHVSAPMRGRPIAHAHTRARGRTQHVGVRRARIGDPFVGVARRACI
jgi:hypothetical protein